MSYHSSHDPEENLPDWLKDLRKRQSQDPTPENTGEERPGGQPAENEPDWLQDMRERYGHLEKNPEPTDSVESEENVLGDTQPIIPNRSAEEPIEPPDHSPATEVPQGKQLEEEAPPPSEETAAEEAGEPLGETPKRDFPDWMEDGAPEDASARNEEVAPHVPAFTEGTEPEIAPGELPSWLEALRPGGAVPREGASVDEIQPKADKTAGPLEGLSGILPVEPEAIHSVKPPVYSAQLELTDSQSQHIAALKKLIEEEGKPKEDVGHGITLPARLLNAFMGVALFSAVLIPLIVRSQNAPRPELDFLPESSAVFDLIEGLPSEAPILVGFDLQPALYGETKAAVTTILGHLLDRQARLVFISTQPTGPGIAEQLLREELASQPAIATDDYINLGYLSGGMAALRSFLSNPLSAGVSLTALGINPWNSPALNGIDSVSDFALVVIVSGNADDARIWIEQGSAELPDGLVAITSAQAAPLLRPYLQSRPQTLRGLVSGIQGAVIYERMRAQEEGSGRALWDAYSSGLGAVLLLILLGGLYGRVIHMRPERTAKPPKSKASTSESKRAI